jgi:hypothetical protein
MNGQARFTERRARRAVPLRIWSGDSRGGGEDILEKGEDVRNTEGLLQVARVAGAGWRFRSVDECPGHEDQGRFASSCGGEEALRG